MTKEEVFEKIQDWESENGESFIDYFESNITVVSFMFWCMGRNYISKENFQKWEQDFQNGEIDANDANYFIVGDAQYSIVNHNEEDYDEKGLKILAEFISESSTYMTRLNKFLDNEV